MGRSRATRLFVLTVLVSSAAILGGGCSDSSKVKFWESCVTNTRRGVDMKEVERVCGKPNRQGTTGPYLGWIYINPKTKQEFHILFRDGVVDTARLPRGNR